MTRPKTRTVVPRQKPVLKNSKKASQKVRKVQPKRKVLLAAIVRDHSGSMGDHGMPEVARKDYNDLVESLKESAAGSEIDIFLSVVICGGPIGVEHSNKPISMVPELQYYMTGGGTPLLDSTGLAIQTLLDSPHANSPDTSFLVQVITDGEERDSKEWVRKLPALMRQLQATERWTFTFRVPVGGKYKLIPFGIPPGNILEWEAGNSESLRKSSQVTRSANRRFVSQLSLGQTHSKSYYADLSDVTPEMVQKKLKDISHEVKFWIVRSAAEGKRIDKFCKLQSGRTYQKGAAFYQLLKTEKVQGYKIICIRHKADGSVYGGAGARKLLKLPLDGRNISLIPTDHAEYEIYVQSTSYTRKLGIDSKVLYWENFRV